MSTGIYVYAYLCIWSLALYVYVSVCICLHVKLVLQPHIQLRKTDFFFSRAVN